MNDNTPNNVPMTEDRINELAKRPGAILMPERDSLLREQKCTTCGNKIGEFRNEKSKREYNISGMCQECQDSVFGSD